MKIERLFRFGLYVVVFTKNRWRRMRTPEHEKNMTEVVLQNSLSIQAGVCQREKFFQMCPLEEKRFENLKARIGLCLSHNDSYKRSFTKVLISVVCLKSKMKS